MKMQRRRPPLVNVQFLRWSAWGAALFVAGQALETHSKVFQAESAIRKLLPEASSDLDASNGARPPWSSRAALLEAGTQLARASRSRGASGNPHHESEEGGSSTEASSGSNSSHDSHDSHESGATDAKHEAKEEEHATSGEEAAKPSETVPPAKGEGEAHSVAVGLISAVVLMPIGLSMALMGGLVQELTLKMVDTFISIFLAVLWFNCFSQFLVSFKIAQAFPFAAELLSFGQIIALYVLANLVAYRWKDDDMRVTTFCRCGAHFIAFAGIAATGQAQAATMEYFPDLLDPIAVFAFVGLVGVFLFAMFVANQLLWRGKCKEFDLMQESIDELELDVVGLVISFLATQGMRVAITGSYPSGHLFLAQLGFGSVGHGGGNDDDGDEKGHGNKHGHHMHHEDWQRWFMFGYAVVLCVVTFLTIPRLNNLVQGNETMNKFVHVTKVILIMLIAWGFLLWGQWEFYENFFRGDPLFGQMVFACGATFTCLFFLYMMGTMGKGSTSFEAHETFDIATTGISLVAAWSWEHCFDTAFDIIGEEYQVGYQGFVPKLVLSIVIPCALLPMYVQHVRPRVREIDERYHKEHHDNEHGDATGHGHAHGNGHGEEAAIEA